MKATTHGAHAVVVTASGNTAYETAHTFLRPRGTVVCTHPTKLRLIADRCQVCVGIPADLSCKAAPSPLLMMRSKLSVVGSIVGSNRDADEALDFAARGLVKPVLTKGGMEDIDRFMDDMTAGKMAGRAVIKIAD